MLVPDLIAYHGSGTSYAGPTVAPFQNADLVNTGKTDGGVINVFSVFDALTAGGNGFGDAHVQVPTTDLSSATMGTGAAGRAPVSPQAAVGLAFGAVSSFGSVGMMPLPRAGVTASGQWSAVNGQWPVVNSPSDSRIGPGLSLVALSKDHSAVADSRRDAPVLLDAVLDELISDPVLIRSHAGAHRFELPIFPSGEITDAPVAVGPGLIGASSQSVPPTELSTCKLAVILLTAGFSAFSLNSLATASTRIGQSQPRTIVRRSFSRRRVAPNDPWDREAHR